MGFAILRSLPPPFQEFTIRLHHVGDDGIEEGDFVIQDSMKDELFLLILDKFLPAKRAHNELDLKT